MCANKNILPGRKDDSELKEEGAPRSRKLVYSDLAGPGMDGYNCLGWGACPLLGGERGKRKAQTYPQGWHPVQPEARHLAFQVWSHSRPEERKSIKPCKETSDHREAATLLRLWTRNHQRDPVRTGDGRRVQTHQDDSASEQWTSNCWEPALCRSLPFGLASAPLAWWSLEKGRRRSLWFMAVPSAFVPH